MRLKVLTTTLLIAGLLLMFGWPVFVGIRPLKTAKHSVQVTWGRRALIYFGVTSAVWLSTAMSALLLARNMKREFFLQESENLKALVEGTLRDHGRNS